MKHALIIEGDWHEVDDQDEMLSAQSEGLETLTITRDGVTHYYVNEED